MWEHGDYPTHTNINKYKSGLDAIYALLGDVQVNWPVARKINPVQGYYFMRRHRWLLYRGDGTIEDPTGAEDAVSISGDGSNWVTYDLSQIDWLPPGRIYQVQGVVACLEDFEGT